MRGTALIVSANECFSGQRGFMYAPKIAWLSRTGIRVGRFLWSVLVAKDAPTQMSARHRAEHVRNKLALLSRRLLKRLFGKHPKIECGSVRVHGRRGARGDPRIDEHRDREILDMQTVPWGHRLVLKVELAPVLLLVAPFGEETLNVSDPPVDVSRLKMSSIVAPMLVALASHFRQRATATHFDTNRANYCSRSLIRLRES